MSLPIDVALWLADGIMRVLPRPTPPTEMLERCKIISHRGEHDNRTVFENTMEAFRIAVDAGAWGLELDIRWTRDLVPMVHHDANTRRVFGSDVEISKVDFSTLREAVPQVPTLDEFVSEFGGKVHLMIEMKAEAFPELEQQRTILQKALSELEPVKDYHLLALDPELFELFSVQPKQACLPVATLNIKSLSRISLARGYAGLSGHFVMLNNRLKREHEAAGQWLGTGFPASKNCLYRELNRGIEYIFTNDALALLKVLEDAKNPRS